jgi:hypothetical protein
MVAGFLLLITGVIILTVMFHHRKGDEEMFTKKINMNKLAVAISEIEGKKLEVNIAQIKEILKITLESLNNYTDEQIIALVHRYKK